MIKTEWVRPCSKLNHVSRLLVADVGFTEHVITTAGLCQPGVFRSILSTEGVKEKPFNCPIHHFYFFIQSRDMERSLVDISVEQKSQIMKCILSVQV